MATKAQIEAAKNSLLASGQQIPASQHRQFEQVLIDELFDAVSRGAVLSALEVVIGSVPEDRFLIIRNGQAKLISSIGSALPQFRGGYNASTNLYPEAGGSGSDGAVVAGDWFYISNPEGGTFITEDGPQFFPYKTLIISLGNVPGQDFTKFRLV